MYRRYYDGYNRYEQDKQEAGQGEVVVPHTKEEPQPQAGEIAGQDTGRPEADGDLQFTIEDGNPAVAACRRRGGLFDRFEIDDLILLGVIVLVLQDSVDDTLLLVVLGFIFLVGFLD